MRPDDDFRDNAQHHDRSDGIITQTEDELYEHHRFIADKGPSQLVQNCRRHWRNSIPQAELWMKETAPGGTQAELTKTSLERTVHPSRAQNAFQRLNKEVVAPDGALVDAQAAMHMIQAALKDALPISRLLAQILVA